MSKIYVSEFPGLAQTDQSDSVNILAVPATVEYTVIVSAGSSGGPALQPSTKFVELSTDTTASFIIASAVGSVAALTNCRLSIGERIVRRVPTIGPSGASNTPSQFAIFTTANV
jgi:hypothetical protein